MKRMVATLLAVLALGTTAPLAFAADENAATETTQTTAAPAIININTASVEALSTLKGIGEKKAQAIIDERKAHGDFDSVDSLSRVKGIGEATVDGLREQAGV